MYTSKDKIAHVMWSNAPHLNNQIGWNMMRFFPKGKILLWDLYSIPKGTKEWQINEVLNKKWLGKLPRSSYQGMLYKSFAHKYVDSLYSIFKKFGPVGRYFKQFIMIVLPDISICSLFRIICSHKKILMHGHLFNPGTVFILWLIGKKIVYIHWGGPIGLPTGNVANWVYKMTFKLCRQIFVLMSPEEGMFLGVTSGLVKTLPYADDHLEGVQYDAENTFRNEHSRNIILGNNAYDHCSSGYIDILKKLKMDEWDRVTAMFNYGKEHSDIDGHISSRIEELQKIGGEKLIPWTTTVPLDEYLSVLKNSAFYFCPATQQAGLGAIANSIKQGKAIFLRGHNYAWMKSIGATVYNIDEISDYSYDNLKKFVPNITTAKRNYEIIYKLFCSTTAQDLWIKTIESSFA